MTLEESYLFLAFFLLLRPKISFKMFTLFGEQVKLQQSLKADAVLNSNLQQGLRRSRLQSSLKVDFVRQRIMKQSQIARCHQNLIQTSQASSQ
jgi:hypothetical protein